MGNFFHFKMTDVNGQTIEQDRQSWFFEDFIADNIDNDAIYAWDIVSIERTDLVTGDVVKIDSQEGLKDAFKDAIDELNGRRRDIEDAMSDLEVAIRGLN